MDIEILPTLLVKTVAEAEHNLKSIRGLAPWIQIDVEDGILVPSRTLDAHAFPESMSSFFVEVDLMVQEPAMYIQEWYQRGARRIILHVESQGNLTDHITSVKKLGMEVAIGLFPDSPLTLLNPFLSGIDRVLLLAVTPGFSGSRFIPRILKKIQDLRLLSPQVVIEVDGGMNKDTIPPARDAGANAFAVNSSIFSSSDPRSTYTDLRRSLGV